MTLGYGTAALGRSLSRRERVRLVDVAYDAGIRYFDTAPLYGGGAAEEALGRALRGKDDVVVATKVGIVPPGIVGYALRRPSAANRFSADDIRAQLEGSLRRLGAVRVDAVLLHEVMPADARTALAALRTLAGELEIGIATSADSARAILRDNPLEVVQLPAIEAFSPAGARLVVHSVLAGRGGEPTELLRGAAEAHPAATILVGSRDPEHIREAAAALG